MATEREIAAHYRNPDLMDIIRDALSRAGKDPHRPTLADLAPIDHFHGGGLAATRSLARRLHAHAHLAVDSTLLDIGSGLGGPARHFAATYGCRVTGVDLTPDFCAVARTLNAMTGMAAQVNIVDGNATALPFPAAIFDHAYSQNISMNIAEKTAFHREAARVLKPGGCFALAEVVTGPGGDIVFPTPWAKIPEHSFVVTLAETTASLQTAGFEILEAENCAVRMRESHSAMKARVAAEGPPVLGFHLIMGDDAKERARNSVRNLLEDRAIPYEIVCRKRTG